MSNRVTCITKPNAHSPLEHITSLGGDTSDGRHWKESREDVITKIRSGNYSFHVEADGYAISVELASRNGVDYVKTKPDATQKDNLLSLPQCR